MYQFKIILNGSDPLIWRRIQVPENYSFWELHVAIQDAMGWDDSHLHQFIIKDDKFGIKVAIGSSDELSTRVIDEYKAKIAKYFSFSNNEASYEYDFGDGWEHDVVLEKILMEDKTKKYPICIAGVGRCPPEDCGGIWGYYDLLEIINDPDHPKYQEKIEFVGEDFDPNDFDEESVVFRGGTE